MRATAAACRINPDTLFTWLAKGKAEKSGKYRDFFERAMEARSQLEQLCLRTVKMGITGGWFDSPVYDQDGRPIPQIDPETGEPLHDAQGRVRFQMFPAYQKPDANLALRVMGRINRSEWGKIDEDTALPDPRTELEKAPTEVPVMEEAEHKRISTSLLARAVKILADQGVPIPGYVPDPAAKKGGDGDVQEMVVSEPKLIEAPSVEKR
jgi:hypothetical protein